MKRRSARQTPRDRVSCISTHLRVKRSRLSCAIVYNQWTCAGALKNAADLRALTGSSYSELANRGSLPYLVLAVYRHALSSKEKVKFHWHDCTNPFGYCLRHLVFQELLHSHSCVLSSPFSPLSTCPFVSRELSGSTSSEHILQHEWR